MRIRVVAFPANSDADKAVHWKVDIFADERLVNKGLTLHDPLDKDGASLCRWYLEQYLQREPHSTTRARKAASVLEGYGQRLADQLQLSALVLGEQPKIDIEIEDFSDPDFGPRSSVHQLYWELLEDERIWALSTRIISVHRSIRRANGTVSAAGNILPWSADSSSRQRINMLLVTARDLTKSSTSGGEISPSVASNILWNMQSRLHLASSPVDLSVEVVRPGTFNALKRHLRRRGQDYFQMIHFDVHGKVGTRKNAPGTSKFSFLYFSDPNGYGTKPIAATQVAKLLHDYNIPIVVLNACESARANAGDDANIAKSLAQVGVKSVLAMMYQTSESATSTFLENFYEKFLIEGRSFTDAATAARRDLRLTSSREARFLLRLPLHDWFVPVVYSSVPELSLVQSYRILEPKANKTSKTETVPMVSLPGREFDLLHLEKRVLHSGLLYLHGPPGVGKTALLRYAESVWIRSSFIDIVVFLDFSSARISSVDKFIDEVLRQMISIEVTKVTSVRSPESHESKAARLNRKLSNCRVLFILDGLADHCVSHARNISGEENLQASVLIPFLQTLLQTFKPREAESRESHLIILSGRTNEKSDFIWTDDVSCYELKGLLVVESVDMVYNLMAGPVSRTVHPTHPRDELRDTWKAEPLIHLLQGNPAAILQFTELARDSKLSLREMYDILHSENPIQRLDPSMLNHQAGLLGEFKRLISTVSDESFATLLMLAWYWHEGPSVSDFYEMLISSKIVPGESAICAALQEASQWGYIEFEEKGRISWIHSLFTIFMRILGCSSFSRIWFDSTRSYSTIESRFRFRIRFARYRLDHLVANYGKVLPWPADPVTGLEYAVRLMVTVLSSHLFRDLNMNFWMYLIPFFRTSERSSERLNQMLLTKGLKHPGFDEYCDRCKQNFLFALKLCRGRGVLPLPHACWPTNAIMHDGHFILHSCNTEESFIIANFYEELLRGAIGFSTACSGRNAVKPKDLVDLIFVASALIEVHRRHIPTAESRTKEFMDLTDSFVEKCEQAFGKSSDPSITCGKSFLSFMKAMVFLDDYNTEDATLEMERALQNLNEILDPSDSVKSVRLEASLSKINPKNAALWRNVFKSFHSGIQTFGNAWKDMTKAALGYSEAEFSIPPRENIHQAGHPFFEIWESFPELYREYGMAATKLNMLEKDIERGQWSRAMGFHTGSLINSMETLDFDQALDHISAQENLAKQHDVEGDLQDKLQNSRQLLTLLQQFVSSICAKKYPSEEEFTSFQEKFVQFSSSMPIEMDQMFEVIKEGFSRDIDPTLAHNSAPGILAETDDPVEVLKLTLQRHLNKSSRSPEYQHIVLASASGVLISLQQLERAEDDSNETAIYTCLARLQQLSEDANHSEFMEKGAIQKRREWNTTRLLGEVSAEMKSLVETGIIDDYSKLLERCRNIINLSGNTNPELREVVNQLEEVTETVQLATLIKPAFGAVNASEHKTAVALLDNILQLVQEGGFSKTLALSSSSRDALQIIREERYHSLVILATDECRWEDGLKLFSEWRSYEELWNRLLASERREITLNFEQVCKSMFNVQDFFCALMELDLGRSASRLGEIRSEHEVENMPNRIVSKAMLVFCDTVFTKTLDRLLAAGPEAARVYCGQCIATVKELDMPFRL